MNTYSCPGRCSCKLLRFCTVCGEYSSSDLDHRRGHPILHHKCTATVFYKSRGGSLCGECIHRSSGLASQDDRCTLLACCNIHSVQYIQTDRWARCSTLQSSRAGRPGCRPPRRRSGQSGHRGACRGGSSCPRSSSRCRPPGRSSAAGSAGPSARPATSPRPPPATAGSPSG